MNFYCYLNLKIAIIEATKKEPLRNAVTCSSLCGEPFLPKSHKRKKSTTCSDSNLTTVSVRIGICRALPFHHIRQTRHRLYNVTSDDLHSVTSNITTEVVTMYPFTSQLTRRLMAGKQEHLCPFTQLFYDLQCELLSF